VIVSRHKWRVKHGCRDEFIELIKAALDEDGVPYRVCSFIYGDYDAVLVDTEYETEEDHLEHSYDWSKPKISEWAAKLDDLVESGTVHELLRVH
jgi:hypothetical protein